MRLQTKLTALGVTFGLELGAGIFLAATTLPAASALAAADGGYNRYAFSDADLGSAVYGKKKRRTGKLRKASAWDGGSANVASGGVVWRGAPGCLPGAVVNAIYGVSSKYGRVVVNSTHRSQRRNRRAGGAHRSYHLQCRAADFRVTGASSRAVLAFLKEQPGLGGIKLYRRGFFHIDNGPRRTWRG